MEFFNRKLFFISLGVIVCAEFLSLLGYKIPLINTLVFWVITIATFVVSLVLPRVGLWIVGAEITIGSFGYLFFIDAFSTRLSIRLAIFIAISLAWLIRRFRFKTILFRRSSLFRPALFLAGALCLGVILGLLRGNGIAAVFYDMNGYLFFLLLFIIPDIIFTKRDVEKLLSVLLAGVTWIIVKTYLALIFFSHVADESLITFVYRWIRITRIGEVTAMVGSFSRIFFQSHLWVLFALIILAFSLIGIIKKEASLKALIVPVVLMTCSMSVVLISYSRSFWLGMVIGLILTLIVLLVKKLFSFKKATLFIGAGILLVVIGLGINAFLIFVPLPFLGYTRQLINTGDLFIDRAITFDEPAANSRFELLKPLAQTVLRHPFIGSGFGTTVTYQSHDPRTQDINAGSYTTYAFEWGYLDILTEIGLVGLLIFGYFIFRLIQLGILSWKLSESGIQQWFIIGLLSSLVILLCIHISTPYLNHPLGIFFIVICAQFFYIFTQSASNHVDRADLKKI